MGYISHSFEQFSGQIPKGLMSKRLRNRNYPGLINEGLRYFINLRGKGFNALQNVFIALQKLANRTKKKTIKKVRQNPNKAKN
jgi:hypothetical protein